MTDTQLQPVRQTTAATILEAIKAGASETALTAIMEAIQFADEREARIAFNESFTGMQLELPMVQTTVMGHHGKFASLGSIVAVVRPILAAHGFSFRHSISNEKSGLVEVTCVISHEAGHSESCTMRSVEDTSGKKNPIQAIASAVSYLRRYTLCASLGITTGDDPDDDGGGPEPVETLSAEQLAHITESLESKQDHQALEKSIIEGFCKSGYRMETLADIRASDYDGVMTRLKDFE